MPWLGSSRFAGPRRVQGAARAATLVSWRGIREEKFRAPQLLALQTTTFQRYVNPLLHPFHPTMMNTRVAPIRPFMVIDPQAKREY
jgi:hypothetical protein